MSRLFDRRASRQPASAEWHQTSLAITLLAFAVPAAAQTVTPGPTGFQRLFFNGASSGNGADLTEDTLTTCSTYSLPAGQLANIGDGVHIVAAGSFGASTDNRTVRIKVAAAAALGATTATIAAQTRWTVEAWFTKTGTNTQKWATSSVIGSSSSPGVTFGTAGAIDTTTLAITVTGQNVTNSVAGSIACEYITVDFIRGGP